MANMSYCRWQNTRMDLDDCANSLNGWGIGRPELSSEEKSARRNLFFIMLDMMEELGLEVPSRNDVETALDYLEQSEKEDAATCELVEGMEEE